MASNFSEPSSSCSSMASSAGDWVVIHLCENKHNMDDYIEKCIPRSHAYQTNHDADCNFCKDDDHQIKWQ